MHESETITLSDEFRIFAGKISSLEEGYKTYSVDALRLELNKLDEKLEKLG